MRRLPHLVVPTALLVGSCSLVLEDAPLATCTSDEDCAPLSQLRGHPGSCRRFFCGDGRCHEHAEGAEICDGHDNDCDGVIDEPSDEAQGPWRPGAVLVEGVTSPTRVSYAPGPEQSAVASWVSRTEARHAELVTGATTRPEPVGYVTNADDNLLSTTLQEGCRDAISGIPVDTCNIVEMVSDSTATHEILATIGTDGCSEGRLHVGHTPAVTPFDGVPVVLRGPLRRSNSFLGIDVNDAKCTGASRPECIAGGGCGAARPSLDVIDHGVPTTAPQQRAAEALVAWIGSSVDRGECGGTDAPVEVLVAHLLRAQIGTPFFWVTASGEGAPATLGRTTGGGAPAVAAWEDGGWFVAFADDAGTIALYWIPSQPEPPIVGTEGDPGDRAGVETPQVQGIVELGTVEPVAAAPDHVALAVGSIRPGGVELGLAWREGCGSADQRMVFRRVRIATDGTDAVSLESVAEAAELARVAAGGGDALGAPSVSYHGEGFVVTGFHRGDLTADDTTDGGWTVAWSRGEDADGDGDLDFGGRIHAARVSELDGGAVADARTGELTQGGDANADSPFLYAGTRYAYHDRTGETFVGGSLACSP